MRRLLVLFLLVALCACQRPPTPDPAATSFTEPAPEPAKALALPNRPGSIKFAVIGDSGRGDKAQFDVAHQMEKFRDVFSFDFVIMLGDNIYDGATADDYHRKFELPYKPFLDKGIDFYATIGNHDDRNQPNYAPFHMGGKRYYTFRTNKGFVSSVTDTDIQFFMIDTETLDRTEEAWIEREMGKSDARWKIPVFHRPIYTSGRYATPARIFRSTLEPMFLRYGVKLALSGHEHFYERTTPQQGITYFISGGAGSLRRGDIRPTGLTARGFDTDYHFMLFEVSRDELFYQAISRDGHSVDSGSIKRN